MWVCVFLFCCVLHVQVDLQVGLMWARGESEETSSFSQYSVVMSRYTDSLWLPTSPLHLSVSVQSSSFINQQSFRTAAPKWTFTLFDQKEMFRALFYYNELEWERMLGLVWQYWFWYSCRLNRYQLLNPKNQSFSLYCFLLMHEQNIA